MRSIRPSHEICQRPRLHLMVDAQPASRLRGRSPRQDDELFTLEGRIMHWASWVIFLTLAVSIATGSPRWILVFPMVAMGVSLYITERQIARLKASQNI